MISFREAVRPALFLFRWTGSRRCPGSDWSIRDANQELVIHSGQIIEHGTHKSLLAQKGFCQRLYLSQFKGQVLPEAVV
jgi:hypothetical protein